MAAPRLTPLLDRLHDKWRDRILTALTVLMVVDLFVVTPLATLHEADLRPLRLLLITLTATALLILSRSIVPLAAIVAAVVLMIAAVVFRANGLPASLDACLEAICWLLVGFVIIWVVTRAVFAPGRITYHRVVGAVLLYLAIGFVFVALFTIIGALSPRAFTGLTVSDRPSVPSDLVYFSFSTLTSVGYGDITPVHPLARSLSNIEAIVGQLYPATLLARLVSLETGARNG